MRIDDLVDLCGIKLEIAKSARHGWIPQWDGRRLVVPGDEGPLYVYHELAHYAIASPDERTMLDWGLGVNVTFYDFYDSEKFVVKIDDETEAWVADPRVIPYKVRLQREADAVSAFLFADNVLDGVEPDDGFDMWGEFGGDQSFWHPKGGIHLHDDRKLWFHELRLSLVRIADAFTKIGVALPDDVITDCLEKVHEIS